MNGISKAAAALGKKGGKSTSDAKAKAAKENGKKGGRPRRQYSPDQLRTMPWADLRGRIVTGACGRRLKWLPMVSADKTGIPDEVLVIDHAGEREIVCGPAADQRVHQGW